MRKLGRIVCVLILFSLSARTGVDAQLIEKAPASPVAVETTLLDSIGSSVTISDILLTGFKKTKPYIIQREVPFKKGEVIASTDLPNKLKLCKQQVMNTSLFVDVDVRPKMIDSSHILIDIHVKERWYLFPIPYFKIVSRNFNT